MLSYLLGFVSWPICRSLRPLILLGSLAGPLVGQPLARPRTSRVRQLTHWSLHPGFVGWPIRWSATPSYIKGSSVDPIGHCALLSSRVCWLTRSLVSHTLIHYWQGWRVSSLTLIHTWVRLRWPTSSQAHIWWLVSSGVSTSGRSSSLPGNPPLVALLSTSSHLWLIISSGESTSSGPTHLFGGIHALLSTSSHLWLIKYLRGNPLPVALLISSGESTSGGPTLHEFTFVAHHLFGGIHFWWPYSLRVHIWWLVSSGESTSLVAYYVPISLYLPMELVF